MRFCTHVVFLSPPLDIYRCRTRHRVRGRPESFDEFNALMRCRIKCRTPGENKPEPVRRGWRWSLESLNGHNSIYYTCAYSVAAAAAVRLFGMAWK